MKVLVFGGTGQLGSEIVTECTRLHDHVVAPTHGELDIVDWMGVRRTIAETAPDAAINCAVFHPIGRCEEEPDRADAVNTYAVANMALACRQANARLAQISTDHVFDGQLGIPYVESSKPNALQAYGRSKVAAEYAVLGASPLNLVVRTASLFGVGGASARGDCPSKILLAAQTKSTIRVRTDLCMSPTYIPDLAQALVAAVHDRMNGVLHLAGGEKATWAELARQFLKAAKSKARVQEVPTISEPFARPRYTVLASERVLALPPYSSRIGEYLSRWNRA